MVRFSFASLFVLAASVAHANVVIASAPVYSNQEGGSATCFVSNLNATPISVTTARVISDQGQVILPASTDRCTSKTLSRDQGCFFAVQAPAPNQNAYFCLASVSATALQAPNVRLGAQQRDPNDYSLTTETGR